MRRNIPRNLKDSLWEDGDIILMRSMTRVTSIASDDTASYDIADFVRCRGKTWRFEDATAEFVVEGVVLRAEELEGSNI